MQESADFEAEEPTKVEAYETLTETARKWREELHREKICAYENQETQGVNQVYQA
jgi:hypothetical protein